VKTLATLIVLALAARPAVAQSGRQALAAGTERYLLADYHSAAPLLSAGLDPKAGSPDQTWRLGVERLADVLLVLRQDSLAATWLRWALRLAPDFDVDVEVVPPAVVRAARAARAFVDSTPSDPFVARTDFAWPEVFRADAPGTVRLASANIPITGRIGADQFLRGGDSRRLEPGSYDVVVSAPGYLPTRLTAEVLPGVTTVVLVSLLPETAGVLYVAARPWGTLSVDGQRIGYTTVGAHHIAAGRHALHLERDGRPAVDTTIVVGERQQARLSWVTKRDTTGDFRIDSALAMLDRGETEVGAELLRQLVGPRATAYPPDVRDRALARLTEATWSLGERDSAQSVLRELVLVDPFYSPPADLFNPELQAAYGRVRRGTTAIGIRAPRDTVVTPLRDSLAVEIAVGQPGEVRLLLRLSSPRPRDSLLMALVVDSVARGRIPLIAPDGSVLAPGNYTIEGEVAASGRGASDLLQLTVERMTVDTAPHEPSVPDAAKRPEMRKRGPSLRTLGEGIGLGALAVFVSSAVNDRTLSGRPIPSAAWVVGGSIALADFAFKRASVPIPENISYNASLRAQLDTQNRAIAAQNATKLRLAPLRIRATREQ
jgi:hypothetical protein